MGFAALPATRSRLAVPSLAPMVKRTSPSVSTSPPRNDQEKPGQRNPLMDDRSLGASSTRRGSKPRERQFQSAGSGVIVDAKNGYIITNHHVVENASEITITLLDNRSFTAKVVGSDEGRTSPCCRRSSRTSLRCRWATPRSRGRRFRRCHRQPIRSSAYGDRGHRQCARALRHQSGGYEDFIQTDASINPGNSAERW